MLIFGTCIDIVLRTKSFLVSKFDDMKDIGEASYKKVFNAIVCLYHAWMFLFIMNNQYNIWKHKKDYQWK